MLKDLAVYVAQLIGKTVAINFDSTWWKKVQDTWVWKGKCLHMWTSISCQRPLPLLMPQSLCLAKPSSGLWFFWWLCNTEKQRHFLFTVYVDPSRFRAEYLFQVWVLVSFLLWRLQAKKFWTDPLRSMRVPLWKALDLRMNPFETQNSK